MAGISKLTTAQRKLLRSLSKDLRDRIIDCILQWESETAGALESSPFSREVTATIRELIRQDAFDGLVWPALEKKERYNTPYHRALLEKLKEQHPDIEVVNGLKTFVRWRAFSRDDIDAVFSDDTEALD